MAFRKIANICFRVVAVCAVVAALLLVGARAVGMQAFAVLSGSMEPACPVGSLVYVKKTEPAELAAGDIITYAISEETAVTHRIVEVVADADGAGGVGYRTKGDANDSDDGGIVQSYNVVGKVVLCVPLLGYASVFVQTPEGIMAVIALVGLLILLLFLPELLRPSARRNPKDRDSADS